MKTFQEGCEKAMKITREKMKTFLNHPKPCGKMCYSLIDRRQKILGNNSKAYVCHKYKTAYHPKNTLSMEKHSGGSIMLCGCFSSPGTKALVKIVGNMDSSKYQSILTQNLQASVRHLKKKKNFSFQHNNDPKHKSLCCPKSAKELMFRKPVMLLHYFHILLNNPITFCY